MDIFQPVLLRMVFLFAFILVGYILSKAKFIPDNSATVLSKLENMVFVPALVMGTFISDFNVETLCKAWKPLLGGFALAIVLIPLSILCAKVSFKEKYLQKIGTYGLAFSNFAFMGNAIMEGVFAQYFRDYILFTLPFWVLIYLYGAPVLLISDGEKKGFGARMKSFLNPMFIGMIIGMVIGLICGWTKKQIPSVCTEIIGVAGSCMSPVAMLLTGMTIAKLDLLQLVKKWRIYLLSFFKLLVFPLLYIGIFVFVPQNSFLDETLLISGMCFICMPTGLNTIVIPAGYGKDTTDAAGIALITHLLSVITIPLMFMLFKAVVL